MRIGWVTCRDPDMLRPMKWVKRYTAICNAWLNEFLVVFALGKADVILGYLGDFRAKSPIFGDFSIGHTDSFVGESPIGGRPGSSGCRGCGDVGPRCVDLAVGGGVSRPPWAIFASICVNVPTDWLRVGCDRLDP